MSIIIEHGETGEQRTLEKDARGQYPRMMAPWRPKGTPVGIKAQEIKNAGLTKISTIVSSWGLPLSMTLSALRWLLGQNCPYCQVGGEFLKLLEDGKISNAECKDLVLRVLNAKDQNDERALKALKGRLEELRSSI